jgi:hypothetical protein
MMEDLERLSHFRIRLGGRREVAFGGLRQEFWLPILVASLSGTLSFKGAPILPDSERPLAL